MSNKSRAVSPLPVHSALRQLSGEGNDSRETCHSPFEAMGEIEGGEESRRRNDLGGPPDTCPLSRPTPSSLTITFLSLSLPLSLLFLSISQQGDKVRLVGRADLQANR